MQFAGTQKKDFLRVRQSHCFHLWEPQPCPSFIRCTNNSTIKELRLLILVYTAHVNRDLKTGFNDPLHSRICKISFETSHSWFLPNVLLGGAFYFESRFLGVLYNFTRQNNDTTKMVKSHGFLSWYHHHNRWLTRKLQLHVSLTAVACSLSLISSWACIKKSVLYWWTLILCWKSASRKTFTLRVFD